MVAGFGFHPPRFGNLNPAQPIRVQDLQAPDMAQLLMQGIGNLGSAFGQGFQGARRVSNEDLAQKELLAASQGMGGGGGMPQQLMALGQPGGIYGGGAQSTLAGGTGGGSFNPRSVPSFTQAGPAKGVSADLKGLFDDATQRYELPPGYLQGTAFIESRYNPNAKNPKSSAGGLFQQIDSNWKEYGVPGASRFDPVASTEAAAKFAAQNRDRLVRALGREPTAGELYLAHQQGPGGAIGLLTNPNASAASVVGSRAVALNGGDPSSMTAGEFASKWINRFPATPTQTAAASTGGMSTARPQSPAGVAPTAASLQAEQQGQAAWQQPPPGQPTPQDREGAAAVVQNQAATQQASKQQQTAVRQASFMGLPSQDPTQNINPLGGGGQVPDVTETGALPAPQAGPRTPPAAVAAPMAPPTPQAQPVAAAGSAMAPPGPMQRPGLQPFAGIPQAPGGGGQQNLMRALGYAIKSGNPSAVSAVQSAIQMSGQNSADWTATDLGGQPALVNRRTAQVIPLGAPGPQKAPEVREINGISHQWNGQQWVPLGGAGPQKAPETIEQGGVRYQWNGQQWVQAVPGAESGQPQFRPIPADDLATRRQLGIPDNDKRLYQVDTRDGKLTPIAEQRAVDDKSLQVEGDLRGQFNTNTKMHRDATEGFGRVQAAIADPEPTPAGDMSLIYGYMKLLDPGSVVRETEFHTAGQAGSLPERVQAAYTKLASGEMLTEAQRADFVRQAFNLQKRNVESYNAQAKRFRFIAERKGADPEVVADIWELPKAPPTKREVESRPTNPLPQYAPLGAPPEPQRTRVRAPVAGGSQPRPDDESATGRVELVPNEVPADVVWGRDKDGKLVRIK